MNNDEYFFKQKHAKNIKAPLSTQNMKPPSLVIVKTSRLKHLIYSWHIPSFELAGFLSPSSAKSPSLQRGLTSKPCVLGNIYLYSRNVHTEECIWQDINRSKVTCLLHFFN